MPRQRRHSLDLDWTFLRADPAGAQHEDVDESSWQRVSLPHTFNDVDTFDDFMEQGHNGERSMFTGRTWYRKRFTTPAAAPGERFLLEFEGVRQAAEVHVNGVQLEGVSENGFLPFAHDITRHLRPDGENLLAVRVDNTFPYRARESGDILSWHDSHWHPTHGGIWRNVHLHVVPPVHLTLPLYSFLRTQGTYVWSSVAEGRARLVVEAEIRSTVCEDVEGTARMEVRTAAGTAVLEAGTTTRLPAGEDTVVVLEGELEDPIPWDPDTPHLYQVTVELEAAGRTDRITVEHGIRCASFTPDQGFFLNGHHRKLVGWGQRPTNEWAGLGAAFPDWMHHHLAALMRSAGADMVRWGHSAGAPADLAAADRLGLITVQPGVDGEGSTVGGVYSEASFAIRLEAWRDAVIRFRNSASVLVWEGGNQSVPRAEAAALRAVVDRWDPHGGRAFAHRRSDAVMAELLDLSIGTEGSRELRSHGLPILEGEYNREEAPRRVWDRSTEGFEDFHTAPGSAYDLTSEELAAHQARHFRKIAAPDHCGGANWIFSDSTSHGRVHSEVARAGGAVDAVMLPKEAYWATAVIFDPAPRAHLIGHWNYPPGTVKDVHVMARAASVELLLDGRSLGRVGPVDEFLFTVRDVAFRPGELRAIARDEEGRVVVEDRVVTTGPAVALRMTPLVRPGGALASGADVIHLDVEAVDAAGRRVPTATPRVDFTHEGPALWRGGYNSGRERSTNETWLDLEAGITRVALRTARVPGDVIVHAAADGLTAASAVVAVREVPAEGGLGRPEPGPEPGRHGPSRGFGPGPDPDHLPPAEERTGGVLFGDVSYSGTGRLLRGTDLQIGDALYSDSPIELSMNPPVVFGAEHLRLPSADRDFKALDLLHLTLSAAAEVLVLHDDRLPRPGWLREGFAATDRSIRVDGRPLTVFRRRCAAGETLTLGGNTDDAEVGEALQYLVLAHPADAPAPEGR